MKDGKCYSTINQTHYLDFMTKIGLKDISLGGCIIAGGAVRDTLTNKKLHDIDIFGTGDAVKCFMTENKEFITSETISPIGHRNLTIKFCDTPVQLIITEDATSVSELFADFDIRMCRFAYVNCTMFYDREGLIDVGSKNLVISSFHTPYLTLTRLPKYSRRGYNLEPTSYKALLEAFYSMTAEELIREKKLIENCEYDGAFKNESN